MNAREIVDRLGGPSVVAKRCGCVVSAISNWATNGVPYRHFDTVRAMGAELPEPVEITRDMLEATRYQNKETPHAA